MQHARPAVVLFKDFMAHDYGRYTPKGKGKEKNHLEQDVSFGTWDIDMYRLRFTILFVWSYIFEAFAHIFIKHACFVPFWSFHAFSIMHPKHKSHRHKYPLIIKIRKNISVSTCLPFLSMPYKLDYALKTQKWKAACNCLAIYDGSFHTWWNTNYIAHVQKWNEIEKTLVNQTWPKWSDTTLHIVPKPVRRIRSFEEWVWSNPTTSKPRPLEISLSWPCECRRRTNSLSIVRL